MESEINSENQNLGNVLNITKKFNALVQPFINAADNLALKT